MIDLRDLPKFAIMPVNGTRNAVEAVIAQMRQKVRQPINLDSLAKHVDLNPFYLSHLFRKHVGISAKRYHQLVRIGAAKHVLAEADMSITNVALECGYDSLGSFVTAFKRTVGLTPSEFRRGLLALGSLEIPKVPPKSVGAEGALQLCAELVGPVHFEGSAFVAVCGAISGTLVNCAAIPLRHRARLTFSIPWRQPLIVFAVAYSSSASIHSAIVGEPGLRARSEVAPGSNSAISEILTLREADPLDAPFVSVLPLLARQQRDATDAMAADGFGIRLPRLEPRRSSAGPLHPADVTWR
jgi:AraC family transcriptional regulator